MDKTKIDWCDSSWNPVTGCLHGCQYCYARSIAKRFGGWEYSPGMLRVNVADDKTYIHPMKAYYGEAKETEYGIIADINDPFSNERGKAPYPFGFTPTFHRYKLDEYQKKKRSRNIFVCSMADLFGEWVPDEWIIEVFEACKKGPQHNYIFLTKNPKRYIELCQKGLLPQEDNFWFGSSATKPTDHYSWFTDQKFHWFLSMEPLLEEFGEINPGAAKPEWVIIGAETGNRKGKVIPRRAWIESLVDQCRLYGIPVFMKDSLTDIWGTGLIREFPQQLLHG